MRIPDYKKRATIAAKNWNRLQAKKNLDDQKTISEKDILAPATEKEQSIELTVSELVDDLVVPRTSVKGIHVVKNTEASDDKLHKIA